jgi:hypothetical protein
LLAAAARMGDVDKDMAGGLHTHPPVSVNCHVNTVWFLSENEYVTTQHVRAQLESRS